MYGTNFGSMDGTMMSRHSLSDQQIIDSATRSPMVSTPPPVIGMSGFMAPSDAQMLARSEQAREMATGQGVIDAATQSVMVSPPPPVIGAMHGAMTMTPSMAMVNRGPMAYGPGPVIRPSRVGNPIQRRTLLMIGVPLLVASVGVGIYAMQAGKKTGKKKK